MKKTIITVLVLGLVLTGCAKKSEEVDNVASDVIEKKEIIENEDVNNEVSEEVIEEIQKEEFKEDTLIIEEETKTEIVETAASSNLSNDICAWGFVRKKNNVTPEFSAKYTKPLDAYEGIYVGNTEEKKIYLTFDEGYENGYTGDILDTLKEKEVTAVFFVTMPYVKQNADLVQRMIDEGHIVGNHTVNHPSMPEVTNDEKLKKEIMDLHDYLKDNFNYEMTFLRPPKGEYSERTLKIALDLGYRTVLWSSAYDDWDVNKQDRLDYARGMILNNLHNGSVILLHAVSKDNTALLGEVIDETRNQGYEFCSLAEFKY